MKLYLRILSFVKPYKVIAFLSIVASVFFVMMNAFSLWMISSLLSTIMQPDKITKFSPITESSTLINKLEFYANSLIGGGSQVDQLKMLCLLLLGSFLLKNVFFYISNISLAFIQNRMIKDIRDDLFEHIQNLPLSFYDKSKSGELASIMIRDVAAMRVAFTETIQHLINSPISIIVLFSMLMLISAKMTLITLLIIPVSGFIVVKLGQSIRRKAKRSSIQIAGVMNILHEVLSGIRIVKAFAMERFEILRFKKENFKFYKLTFRQAKLSHITTPINDMIGVSIGIILLWIGGKEVLTTGSLSSESFIRFIIYLFAMMDPIKKLSNVNTKIQAGLASADRVFNVMDTPSNIVDPKNPVILNKFEREIKFTNVHFNYEQSDRPALSRINLTIQKGEMVALVGSSGAGKTTLVDLIPRFYDVSSGAITIDGTDVRDMSLDSLRSLMGIVNQDTILFNDTVGNNISYGLQKSDFELIKQSAKAANALEFIKQLPKGFDTIVGEKGTRLSGGQRQRISIARAILKNPSILILDEATSSLDTESERKVQNAIDNLVKDRTVIVIAHRLSTVVNADKIIVLDNGILTEIGKHDDLIKSNGIYKQLYDLQFKDRV
ncbi:MAG: ABC transporter ATP-binding protein [Candidatus Marinimicrobia bacterium]|nr:ABC transporter ATP-binding protein [Candidatus Neomarinimicrobiota bacterium]MBL7109412.1 ABC transporter ATP-binding protein [Candidatus Neomarinimicrobiota bacterium]